MKRSRKWLVILIAIGAIGLFASRWFGTRAEGPLYRTVTVARGDVESTVLATGVVQPQNRLEIKPPISGRAEQILVREGQPVRKGQIVAWMSSTERAALLDAARARGPEELARWEDLFRPTPLIAPLAGVVIAKNVEPGQTVTSQDAVLVMSDRLIIKAQVDETDIAQIYVGQTARVSLDAYPQQIVPAEVDHISYEAKTVNNVTVYEVEVVTERVPDFMRSGMTANVTFVVAAKQDRLLLPAEAVHLENGAASVLRPSTAENTPPASMPIETGLTNGKQVEIVAGLAEGDAVLVPELKLPAESDGPPGSPLSPMGAPKRSSVRH